MALSSVSKSALSAKPTTRTSRSRVVVCAAHGAKDVVKKVAETAAAVAASALIAGAASALTRDELQGLTYLQVKGTGVANTCSTLKPGAAVDAKNIRSGSYMLENMCIEPSKIQVKEEGVKAGEDEFVDTLLMTRNTYTLDGLSGKMSIGSGGSIEFVKEDEGIDFAPVTVQLPGGERVPFLFTFKDMKLKGNLDGFSGEFTVPSYRGSTFLDPKGRGGSTGYDTAVALPASGDRDELFKENIKSTASAKGSAAFSVANYDPASGEIVGVFESIQPSDTDLGAKTSKEVKITGIWYGQLA